MKKTVSDWCARGIFVILVLFMISIGINVIGKLFDRSQDENKAAAVNWSKLYPFEEEESEAVPDAGEKGSKSKESSVEKLITAYVSKISGIEDKISDYAEKMFFFQKELVMAGSQIENMIGWELESDTAGETGILYMENGYLTNVKAKAEEETIDDLANSVEDLYGYLDESGIPFLYLNAASKVCRYDRQLPDTVNEHSNENADALLEALSKRGVPFIDYREQMEQASMNHYDYYYKTDLHWTTEAGLWAAGVLANILNESYGFQFDQNYFDLGNYDITEYKSYWIGTQGRTVTLAKADLEDWYLMLPKFPTNYTVSAPSRGMELTGTYEEALYDMEGFSKIASYSGVDYLNKQDPYACSRISNYNGLTIITNNLETNNPGKRILMIQDSFGNFMSAYLAADVEQVDVIYPKQFTGSIRSYIEQTEPDMVIVLFSQDNIGPVDWETHTSIFDFR